MNLVFLNSFEKEAGEGRVKQAQVSIGETHGIWHVIWNEAKDDGKSSQEAWYEGNRWDEMLEKFRLKLHEKMGAGYVPLIDGVYEGGQNLSGKSKFNAMLQYYSELHSREEVFQRLREWRREAASREGKAPFILASNRVLRMIAAFLPQTVEELKQIPGFGAPKAAIYGEEVCKATRDEERATSFPLDWVPGSVDEVQFQSWLRQQKELKLRAELDKQAQKRKLLESIGQGAGLQDLQKELSMPRRDLVQWIEELDGEGYDLEALLDGELEAVGAEEQLKAWQAFETEGCRYLKPVLHRIYSAEELQTKDLAKAYEWLRLLRLKFRKTKEAMRPQAG
jgi:hypothetical protein